MAARKLDKSQIEAACSGNGFPNGWVPRDLVQRDLIMIKTLLFAVALSSLALAGGCAKGGNGTIPTVTVTVPNNTTSLIVNSSVVLTATVDGVTDKTVAWTLSGTGCTGSACGTLTPITGTTPATATYQAPATTAPGSSPLTVTIKAAWENDNAVTGTLQLRVSQVSVVVTPTAVTVGQNLAQQFTAVAIPDNAPQTFTWSVTCTGGTNCGTITPVGASNSDVAVYTAPSSSPSGVVVTTTSTVQQSPASDGVGTANVTVAPSRLTGTYAFHFSGYDSSNRAVATAGSVTFGSDGTVASGVEDVVIDGVYHQYTMVSGSYTPISSNNNLGTLTLTASGGPSYTYTAGLSSAGAIRMIESDSAGTGSGVMQQPTTGGGFNTGKQTFVFGFTGVDLSRNRGGYAGMLPMNGSGVISGGLADSNDNGTTNSYSSVTGTYQYDAASGLGHMALTLTAGTTLNFDFFVAGGGTQTKTGPNPLTLYAISPDSTYQALSGSMVYQVPMTYNNAAFAGTSVSNLTGANANVSLTFGTTDGTSGGTGGTGNFTGGFDQNNNRMILSVSAFPSAAQSPSPYTYVATGSGNGRYIFQMLGNPNASTAVAPLPFVLYASGANRGFLLDQSSPAVMTGTMDPHPALKNFDYAPSELPGTYAAAPIPNSNSTLVPPAVENLLLTWPGGDVSIVGGTQNPGNGTLTGNYTINFGSGTGMITLTAPAAATYVIYAIDATTVPNPAYSALPNYAITDFMMIGTTSGTPSSVIFAQQ